MEILRNFLPSRLIVEKNKKNGHNKHNPEILWKFQGPFALLSGCSLCCLPFQVILMQVKTARNESDLQNHIIQSTSAQSFVAVIPFYPAKRSLWLNASIHSQQCAMDAVEVTKNLLVELCQFCVHPYNSVFFAFVTLLPMRTSFAIFTLIVFFCSSICAMTLLKEYTGSEVLTIFSKSTGIFSWIGA